MTMPKNPEHDGQSWISRQIDHIDHGVDWLHQKVPALSILSDDIWQVAQTTRDQTQQDISNVMKIFPEEKVEKGKQLIETTAANLAQVLPGADKVFRQMVKCTPTTGLLLMLSGCSGGRDDMVKKAAGDYVKQTKTGGDYSIEIFSYGMIVPSAELLALIIFYQLGGVGFTGKRKIDDSAGGLLIGILVQFLATGIILNNGGDTFTQIFGGGIAGGIAATGAIAAFKGYKKGPNDKVNL